MLTPNQAQDITTRLVELARTHGASAADAMLVADMSSSVTVRLGELEDVSRSEGQ